MADRRYYPYGVASFNGTVRGRPRASDAKVTATLVAIESLARVMMIRLAELKDDCKCAPHRRVRRDDGQ